MSISHKIAKKEAAKTIIGLNIKKHRELNNLNEKEFGDLVNESEKTIKDLENGTLNLDDKFTTVIKIADILNLKYIDLFKNPMRNDEIFPNGIPIPEKVLDFIVTYAAKHKTNIKNVFSVLDINITTLQNWKRKKSIPSPKYIQTIIDYLGITLKDLLQCIESETQEIAVYDFNENLSRKEQIERSMRLTIGKNIKVVREEKTNGLPIENFAIRVNLTKTELEKLENGTNDLWKNFPLLIEICEALNCRFEDIMENEGTGATIKGYKIPVYFFKLFEDIRRKKKINIAQFCKNIGVSKCSYNAWIKGKYSPSPEFLQNLMIILEIKAKDLKEFERTVDKTKLMQEPKPKPVKTKPIPHSVTIIPEPVETEEPTNVPGPQAILPNPLPAISMLQNETDPLTIITKAYNMYKNAGPIMEKVNEIIKKANEIEALLNETH